MSVRGFTYSMRLADWFRSVFSQGFCPGKVKRPFRILCQQDFRYAQRVENQFFAHSREKRFMEWAQGKHPIGAIPVRADSGWQGSAVRGAPNHCQIRDRVAYGGAENRSNYLGITRSGLLLPLRGFAPCPRRTRHFQHDGGRTPHNRTPASTRS